MILISTSIVKWGLEKHQALDDSTYEVTYADLCINFTRTISNDVKI